MYPTECEDDLLLDEATEDLTQTELATVAADHSQPIAKIKRVNSKQGGAVVFDEPAKLLSKELGIDLGEKAYLRLDESQIETAAAHLEAAGYAVMEQRTAQIGVAKRTATVFDQAAEAAAPEMGMIVGFTEKSGRPKLKVPIERLDELKEVLEVKGFRTVENQISMDGIKPKAVFREADRGATYFVFDASAENVAEFLGVEPDQTPGGRPMLTFDREAYWELKTELKEAGFDISQKDYDPFAQISTFDSNKGFGAVIVGTAAQEVAGMMGLPLESTKPTAKTGAPLPKVTLRGDEQIQLAQSLLQDHGYKVEVVALAQNREAYANKKYANVSQFSNDQGAKTGVAVFGEAAPMLAEKFGIELLQTNPPAGKEPQPYVKLKQEQFEAAKPVMEQAGFTVNVKDARQQYQQAGVAVVKSMPVKKTAAVGER